MAVCVYGFRMMLLVNKVAVVAASGLFLMGFYVFWNRFDPATRGPVYRWGDGHFWPAFASAVLIILANPISFGAFLGDWSRYVPRDTSKRALMAASTGAQFLGLVPCAFGLITASIIAREAPKYLESINYAEGCWR